MQQGQQGYDKVEGRGSGASHGGQEVGAAPIAGDVLDVIIVGSGFGGAVAACRLAQANQQHGGKLRIVLLERGRRYQNPAQDFPRLQIPEQLTNDSELASSKRLPDLSRFLWRNDHGLFDVRDLGNLRVVQSAGLGGGSLIYAAVHLRPPAEIFDQGWPQGYTRPALDPYYTLVESMLDVSPVEDGTFTKTKQMAEVARKLNRTGSFVRPPLAVNLKPLPGGANRFGVNQSACVGCGDCTIGCPHGAKNTLDHNYLADAEKQGVEIRTLAEVFHLERVPPRDDGPDLFQIKYRDHLRGGLEKTIKARHLFLCAGAVNTTELLLNNRQNLSPKPHEGGLAHVGKSFFANGDAPGVIFDTEEPWAPAAGPTITTAMFHRGDGGWFLLQDGGIPRTLQRSLGFLRSPLWLGRNRFAAKGRATPARADSGWSPGGLATFLRGLPHLATLNTHSGTSAQPSAERPGEEGAAAFLSFLPADLRELLQPLSDPAGLLSREINDLDDQAMDGLRKRWSRSVKWMFVPLLKVARGKDLLEATTDALVSRFPWLSMARTAPNLAVMSMNAALALLLGPVTNQNVAVLLAMGPDQAWTIKREPGRPTIATPVNGQAANVRLYGSQERLMRDVAGALGGELRTNPGWTLGRRPASVHAQGGCAMGEGREAVTDPSGEVRGCPNLFVLDGAALPRSVGVNPSSTIAAIAERNVEAFIRTKLGFAEWSARQAEARRDDERKTPAEGRFDTVLTTKATIARGVEEVLFADGDAARAPATAKVPSLQWDEVMDGFVAPVAGAFPKQWPIQDLEKAEFQRLERVGAKSLQRLRASLKATIEDLDRALLSLDVTIGITGSVTAWWPKPGLHVVRPTRYDGITGTLRVNLTNRLLGSMRYELKGKTNDGPLELVGVKQLRDDPGLDAWRDLTTLHVVLTVGEQRCAGIVRVPLMDFIKTQLPSMAIKGDDIAVARKAYLTMKFIRHFQRGLANIYPAQGV